MVTAGKAMSEKMRYDVLGNWLKGYTVRRTYTYKDGTESYNWMGHYEHECSAGPFLWRSTKFRSWRAAREAIKEDQLPRGKLMGDI